MAEEFIRPGKVKKPPYRKREPDHSEYTFQRSFKAAREARNLTQGRLSKMVGLSRTHIGNIERGSSNPTLETLNKIAEVLDCKLLMIPK